MRVEIDQIIEALKVDNLDFFFEYHLDMLNIVASPGDNTFLHTACICGNKIIAKYLLDNGADVELTSSDNDTPVWCAFNNDHTEILIMLVQHGADINAYGQNGTTIFQEALLKGKWNIVKLLANLPETNINKPTEGFGPRPTISFLIKGYLDTKLTTDQKLAIEVIEDLILSPTRKTGSLALNLEFVLDTNQPIFQQLLQINSPKILDFILNNKQIDLNKFNKHGKTILITYVEDNNIDMINMLHKTGKLDLNFPDTRNFTPIKWAIVHLNLNMLKHLVTLGAILTYDLLNWTVEQALISQNISSYNHVINYLGSIQNSVIHNKNYKCCTLLHHASSYGWISVVKGILTNCNNDPKIINTICTGVPPPKKCIGCDSYHESHLKIISNISQPHETPLFQATSKGHVEIIQLLLNAKADISIGRFPLIKGVPVKSYIPFINHGLIDFYKNINSYDQFLRKTICIHLKLNKNNLELVSHSSINDIPDDLFILLENGIFWNVENLVSYIITTVHGVNNYDQNAKSFDPVLVGQIFTKDDLTQIFKFNIHGQKLKTFINMLNVDHDIDSKFMNLIHNVGSILWCRGSHFNQYLKQILTDDELRDWNSQWVQNLSDDNMPSNMSVSVSKKIEFLKQTELSTLFNTYKDLSDSQKSAFNTIYVDQSNKPFDKRLDQVCRAQFCAMSFGAFLVETFNCYNEYSLTKPQIKLIDNHVPEVPSLIGNTPSTDLIVIT